MFNKCVVMRLGMMMVLLMSLIAVVGCSKDKVSVAEPEEDDGTSWRR